MASRKLTPEVVAAAKRLREAGKTIDAIAAELHVSKGSVGNALRGPEPKASPPPAAPIEIDPDRDELKELDSIIATVGDRLRDAADANDVTRTGSLGRLYASLISARRKIAPREDDDGVWISNAEIEAARNDLLSKLDRVAQSRERGK